MNDPQKETSFCMVICLVPMFLMMGLCQGLPCGNYIGEIFQMEIDYNDSKSYALFTLGENNLVTMIDSTEGGTLGAEQTDEPGFTSQLGRWQCVSEYHIEIRSVNYVHPILNSNNAGVLCSSEWSLNFVDKTYIFGGTLNYAYYRLGSNPFNTHQNNVDLSSFGSYQIKGERLVMFNTRIPTSGIMGQPMALFSSFESIQQD